MLLPIRLEVNTVHKSSLPHEGPRTAPASALPGSLGQRGDFCVRLGDILWVESIREDKSLRIRNNVALDAEAPNSRPLAPISSF